MEKIYLNMGIMIAINLAIVIIVYLILSGKIKNEKLKEFFLYIYSYPVIFSIGNSVYFITGNRLFTLILFPALLLSLFFIMPLLRGYNLVEPKKEEDRYTSSRAEIVMSALLPPIVFILTSFENIGAQKIISSIGIKNFRILSGIQIFLIILTLILSDILNKENLKRFDEIDGVNKKQKFLWITRVCYIVFVLLILKAVMIK